MEQWLAEPSFITGASNGVAVVLFTVAAGVWQIFKWTIWLLSRPFVMWDRGC